jgi:WD40 repeat protein
VAVKLIKAGMDSRQVIARFEAERQALALMDHPNIAKVLDAGTTGAGRPYFVMDLVKGVPITRYCDEHRLTPRQRLELFIPVCQAVQHAHQKGIIHRDLKPSNVLVALYDGKPVPKVIDFGVVKAAGQALTEKTLVTGFGAIIGTLEYMSPEQAEINQLDIDTRSDIYSLGVLFYELLAGTTPLDRKRVKESGMLEALRIIREEDAPTLSNRLARTEELPAIAANRGLEPAKLTKLVRGELDWIVMKALEKDRNRRYESASTFAADIQRYLKDEPVLACPPSAWYRFRKFARRNKAALATASTVGLAVVVAVAVLAVSTVVAQTALRAETRAKDNLEDTLERERRDSYFHRIALAQRELSANNLGGALRLLGECPEDLRDWEWNYLQRLCRVDPITLQGRGTGVCGAAFSPDGRRLAAANDDGTVGLFDVESGAELPPLRGHTNKVRSVAFHPLSTRLASAGLDGTVRVWNLTTSQEVFRRGGHAGLLGYGVAFSPDGRYLAAGGDDGSLIIWDAIDGQELRRLSGHGRMALCVDFSPDGRLLATGDWTGVLRVWDAETGGLLRTSAGDGRVISAAKFSPDGRRLATASYDRVVKLWDVAKLLDPANRDEPRAWRGHDCIIVGLAFSPDSRRLATIGGEDKTVKLWDPLTGREILKLRGHTYFGMCVAFSPDGQRLASSGKDGTVRIWDARPATSGQELLTLKHDDEVWSVAFSPDGQRIASSSWDKTVRLWDGTTGAPLRRLTLSSQGLLLAFSRDGKRLASISRDKTARIWDATTGEEQSVLTTPNDHLYGVTFSPDGRFLLVDDVGGQHGKTGGSHAVTVWDAQAGQTSPKVLGIVGRHREDIWCLKFSADGKFLASGSNDGTVKLWHWDPAWLGQPQEPVHKFPVRNYGFGDCVAFTPNSQRLITASGETVTIWDVKSGDVLHKLPGHSGDVIAVAVSPDGRWLATAGEDTTIALWDTVTWERRHTLRGHTGMVMSLAFSPVNPHLVSASRDGKVKIWDLTRWVKGPDR